VVVDEVRGVEEFVGGGGGGGMGFDDCAGDDTWDGIRLLAYTYPRHICDWSFILHLHIPHSFAKSRYFLRYVSH
jgi:hypothetical protein